MDGHEREYSTTQRIGVVCSLLWTGGTITPFDVAEKIGITYNGAWKMLGRLSGCLPVVEENGEWWIPPEFFPGYRR